MKPSKKNSAVETVEPEDILITLDQVSQTIEIMNSVVGRLKHHLVDHLEGLEAKAMTEQLQAKAPKRTDIIH